MLFFGGLLTYAQYALLGELNAILFFSIFLYHCFCANQMIKKEKDGDS